MHTHGFDRPAVTRRRVSTLTASLLLGLASTWAAPAFAGTEMHMSIQDLDSKTTAPLRTFTQDGKLRVEEGERVVMIFRDKALYALDTQERTYHVLDQKTMQQLADQLNPVFKQMQEQLAQLPPEQRAQMEQLMGGQIPGMGAPPRVEMRRTARNGEYGGHACRYVEVMENGTLSDEVCVTDAKRLPGADEFMAVAKEMSALMKQFTSAIQIPGLAQVTERYSTQFDELGGIPVFTRHYADGKPDSETRLESIRSHSLPAALFEIPQGYTRKDMLSGR